MIVVDTRVRSPHRPDTRHFDARRTDPIGLRARVAVIDRRGHVRALVARAIVADPLLELAVSSACVDDALGLSRPPDLIVLGPAEGSPAADTGGVALAGCGSAVLVLDPEASSTDSSPLARCAQLGTTTCGSCTVSSAIHEALAGGSNARRGCRPEDAESRQVPQLSAQERRALALYASGATLDSVAASMYVSPNTAATYLRRVREKLRGVGERVESKLELRDTALRLGLLD